MDLEDLRRELDGIDSQLLQLFYSRMEFTKQIGAYKKENGPAVYDPARERQVLMRIAEESPKGLGDYAAALYASVFELSRARQSSLRTEQTAPASQIDERNAAPSGLHLVSEKRRSEYAAERG